MSRQFFIGATISIVAALALLAFWHIMTEDAAERALAHDTATTHKDGVRTHTEGIASGAGAFRAGDTYDTLASRLQGNVDSDPNARALLAEAAAQCENLGGAIPSPKAADTSNREYRAWRAHFCGRARDYDSNRFRTTFATLGDAKQLVNEDGGLIPGKTQQAIDIILNSRSYADIQAAGDYLLYMPEAKWNIGEARVAGTPMEGKLKELQRTAIESVACIFSGACEAGGLKTMQICAMKRLCAPGVTLYDVWESTYSPQEMAAINDIQRALLNQRNARRTSI